MIVSDGQQSGSIIYIYILFRIISPIRLLHNIEPSSLGCTVGPCWLPILLILVAGQVDGKQRPSSFVRLRIYFASSFEEKYFRVQNSRLVSCGWCFFFPLNSLYFTPFSSLLHGFWEVSCNSYLCSLVNDFSHSGFCQDFSSFLTFDFSAVWK